MPIDMSLFFPKQRLWPSLKWLGGHDWLSVFPLPGFRCHIDLNTSILQDVRALQHEELVTMLLYAGLHLPPEDWAGTMLALFIGATAFNIGPKIFSPSAETCEALENADLNLSWSEFRLPYPTLLVEYPRGWADRMRHDHGLQDQPIAAMIGQVGPQYVQVWVQLAGGGELHGGVGNWPEYRTIEESIVAYEDFARRLGRGVGAEPIPEGERILMGVTLNLAGLLSHCGTKELGWVDPGQRLRHERKRGRRGETLALGDLMRVEAAKPIEVLAATRVRGRTEWAGGTHASPRSHWRRGHYRMQPYGEGRLLRRQQFIAPVLVSGDRDDIDPSDLPVRYEE